VYSHIHTVKTQQYVRQYHYVISNTTKYITTTCFGPASRPSSGCSQNHQADYTTGVWGGRDLVLHNS